MPTAPRLLAALALLATPAAVRADEPYAMSVGLGVGLRPALPSAYRPAGDGLPLLSLEFAGSRRLRGALSIAASAAWTPHALDVTTEDGSRTFDFTLYHLGAGLSAAAHPLRSVALTAGLEVGLALARWEAAAVGSCGEGCVVIGEGAAEDEVHLAALGRARALRVWRGSGPHSDDDFGAGLEARWLVATDHASGIPLGHGVILVVLAYGGL